MGAKSTSDEDHKTKAHGGSVRVKFQDWCKGFEKRLTLRSNNHSAQSFSALITHGCERKQLEERIYAACLSPRHLLPFRIWSKHGRRDYIRDARNLANSLKRSVAFLRKALDPRRGGMPGLEYTPLEGASIDLKTLERYAQLAEAALKNRLEGMSQSEALFPIPDSGLFRLWAYVRIATGRDHYREIADLIEVGKDPNREEPDLAKHAICSNWIRRFIRKRPSLSRDIFNRESILNVAPNIWKD